MRCNLSSEETESASHPWPTYLTHCTLPRPRFSFPSFFIGPTKSTTMGTRSKTTSPITLWHNAPPQADSAQSVGRTFGEADSSHATRRGCRRSWRHPRREGRRWSARGGTPTTTPATTSHPPPPLPCPFPLVLLSLSHHRTPAAPATPSTVFPTVVPARSPPAATSPPPSVSLSLSRSLYRGSHHRLRYRLAQLSLVRARQSLQHPNAAHRRLLRLHSHLHLPPPFLSPAPPSRSSLFRRAWWYKLQKGISRYCNAASW